MREIVKTPQPGQLHFVSMPAIRIMTVDDHLVLRAGIKALLEREPLFEVVAEACSGEEAIEVFRSVQPDITLMDIQMPGIGGLAATQLICRDFPDARIIVLTTYAGDVQAKRALDAGAKGYVLKSVLPDDMMESVERVMAGQIYITRDVAEDMAAHAYDDDLTDRETEVMGKVATGASNGEIAASFGISRETVKIHVKRILSKLGAADRTRAVAIALNRGICWIHRN